ncbi:MAG: glutaconyl-CoA decarboxylase subunit beta [Candidatus Rokubacteria bacterium RIFCSPLOWO2_12_FULL_71_22]|nr:MAG: glutaconyl-CoA decarboxylase subunit beta [Candidatus Rokubacteria bacterium RIFCSPLOWO2_02_FULL_72_37]OGL19125.1 MAG: glutaconyl-CoA decarboxylase subunit beta [Candidatus Rokubacteria bacterium RIFCSPLOWO2_12_FULL_71_22]
MPDNEFLGVLALTWQAAVMLGLGGLLIYLGIAKQVEPVLLVPIGAGVILANIPLGGLTEPGGLLAVLRAAGIETELFPLLIFIGVGAMIDFGSLLERPYTVFLGAAAQFGIFGTFFLAYFLGDGGLRLFDFSFKDAVSIGIIGSADGPTSIYVATVLGSKYAASIVVAAYSYMALVPIIQPPIMRALTTDAERRLTMPARARGVSRRTRVLFPVVTIVVVGLIAPKATPLIGTLMFGNLLRESGVLERLSQAAQNEMTNIVTILLGLTVGGMMSAADFLRPETIMIYVMGVVAFAAGTAAGLVFGKVMYVASGKRINPLIGAAGISAFPMCARVVQKVGLEANPHNHLIMHAAGANTAGQIASVVAGGAALALVPFFA